MCVPGKGVFPEIKVFFFFRGNARSLRRDIPKVLLVRRSLSPLRLFVRLTQHLLSDHQSTASLPFLFPVHPNLSSQIYFPYFN